MWAAIVGFLQALPQLIRIYTQVRAAMDQDETNRFLADVANSTALAVAAKDAPNLEARRELRRKALDAGSDLFGRIAGG